MKSHSFSLAAAAVAALLFTVGCDNTPNASETPTATEAAVTNPLFKIAPAEYATLAEQSLTHLAAKEFDAWSALLADDVEYDFPDGDQNTRTKLKGKEAVIGWWKNYRSMPAVKSMTMSEFNHMPIEVTGEPKGGAKKGTYVISYFTNTQVINGQTVGIRMNFSTHFNADKKIDRYAGYYDRTLIVKALGRNLLAEGKADR
jgi:ketosteroid isomerase-like protein